MQWVLTLVAARESQTLSASTVQRVIDAAGGEAPVWLSPGEAADIPGIALTAREAVLAALGGQAVDALFTPASSRRYCLLVCDMDSTIVAGETLDDLAAHAGIGDAVAAITQRSMNGQIGFREALRIRVALLRGLGLGALEDTWRETRLMPGAQTLIATMRAHGAFTALVSGGFTFFTERVAALCGFDHHRANSLHDDGTQLTGTVAEPILGPDTKRETLLSLAAAHNVPAAQTLAIGDGANDLAMLREAGLGIAYYAKPIVRASIVNQINHADLQAALFAQGYRREEFVEKQ